MLDNCVISVYIILLRRIEVDLDAHGDALPDDDRLFFFNGKSQGALLLWKPPFLSESRL